MKYNIEKINQIGNRLLGLRKWCTRIGFVCDGATWIWKLISHYYPQAIQIVDWYHAEDRLKRIA